MLAKSSTQLTMHTHPSAGVFNPLKFALSRKEDEEEEEEEESCQQPKNMLCKSR